mmetsp:Transcript_80091/g.159833  ORF Transcript_80091/g.159833 Transcript_80091/m.159833 type:complete len:368 (+) Transcript_80091:142-1245(+)
MMILFFLLLNFATARTPTRVSPRVAKFRNPIPRIASSGGWKPRVLADCIAGAGAGLVAYTLATPLETVKTLVQKNGGTASTAFKEVVGRGGKRGLFKSLRGMYAGGIPYSMILYGVYGPLKAGTRKLLYPEKGPEDFSKKQLFLVDLLAAAGAEVVGLVAFVPGELVAKRMMLEPLRYPGVGAAMAAIFRSEGLKGLFTGFGACLVRDVPYTCIQFALFDAAVGKFFAGARDGSGEALQFHESFAVGTLCAFVASTATLPIDVVKSQVMLAKDASLGVVALVAALVRTSGKGALFRGYPTYLTINIIKWSSSQAVYNAIRGPITATPPSRDLVGLKPILDKRVPVLPVPLQAEVGYDNDNDEDGDWQ